MIEYVQQSAKLNEQYAKAHLEDIPADRWCEMPAGHLRHAASIVGHVAVVYAFVSSPDPDCPDVPGQWVELFADGAVATGAPEQYPGKDELIATVGELRARTLARLTSASPADLEAPVPDERMAEIFPTVGTLLVASLTMHEAVHLGQLSAWREAVGLTLHI